VFGYASSTQKFYADSRPAAPSVGFASNFNTWNGYFPEPSWGSLTYYGTSETRQAAVYGAERFNVADPLKLIFGTRVTNTAAAATISTSTPTGMQPWCGLPELRSSDRGVGS